MIGGAGPPLRIGVVGGSAADDAHLGMAEAVGAALARAGAVLVCGGRGGVMEAAARGAHEAGGLTVGVLPGADPAAANPWIVLPLATGMGEARNALVVRFSDAVVAVGGAWGTLSEIALARAMDVPVAVLGTPPTAGLDLPAPEGPDAAVAWALDAARRRRSGAE